MQDLFLQIFNKKMDAAGNRNLLLDITNEYPYFAPAHFFLLKNTETGFPGYDKIAAKTALHFDNPFLLNYRLLEVEKVDEVEKVEVVQENEKMDEAEKVEDLSKDELVFEPLFASDYFASQGIKLSEEIQTGDKLGKQLKSFTEWLKSMKKVHDMKGTEGNVQIDLAVQQLAEKSNREDFILTESMAEAYLQQGKLKKARETFEKLSLLIPAKSAYFAAKIESISIDQ
jgi:hypothetical protein